MHLNPNVRESGLHTCIHYNFISSELTQKLEYAKDVTEEVSQLIQALYFNNAGFDLEKRRWFDKVGFAL